LFWDNVTGEIQSITTSKTFVIDHPMDSEKYLVHACLEGPEAGVYYRGEETLVNEKITVILPNYVKSLATDFTVHITPIGKPRLLGVSRVINGMFDVYGESGDFFWSVYGKRQNIETEPLKYSVKLKGDGPYKWIN
jgi:hypothetical protein